MSNGSHRVKKCVSSTKQASRPSVNASKGAGGGRVKPKR